MNRYELVYILDTALEEEVRKEQIERFNAMIASNSGTVEKVDEWGKRRLAYPINFKNEGYYVLVNFSAGSDVPRELERNLQIADSVIRYQIIKLEQKRSNVKPRPMRAAPVAAPAAFGPAAEAAPARAAFVTASAVAEPVVEVMPVVAPAAEVAAPVETNDAE